MSIFKANEFATKAFARALDATNAAETCDSDRAMQLILEAQRLIGQANNERSKHTFTLSDADRLEFELEVAANVTTILNDSNRLISEAQFRIEQCRRAANSICVAKEALNAARACDFGRARRLAESSRALDDSIDAAFRIRLRRLSLGKRLADARRSLDQIERLRRECAKRRQIYPFEEAGTFDGTTAGLDPTKAPVTVDQKNRIVFVFNPTKALELDCDSICLVSVQHFEDLTKCGMVVEEPGSVRRGGAGFPAPLDSDAVDGYVVDTSPKSECPCLPADGQRFVVVPLPQIAGQPPGTGIGLRGTDEPNDATKGFELHFETAAVCFKVTKKSAEGKIKAFEITILQTMRWVLEVNQKGALVSRILKNGQSIDWGAPSLPFQKALRMWLKAKDRDRGPCPMGYLQKRGPPPKKK